MLSPAEYEHNYLTNHTHDATTAVVETPEYSLQHTGGTSPRPMKHRMSREHLKNHSTRLRRQLPTESVPCDEFLSGERVVSECSAHLRVQISGDENGPNVAGTSLSGPQQFKIVSLYIL